MARSMKRKVFDDDSEAFNRHDVKGFTRMLADDASCNAPGGIQLRGRDAVAAFYAAWIDGFPDAHVDIEAVHETDDCLVEVGTFSGTHRGTLRAPDGEIPPTGRHLNVRYMQVVRVEGEQITSFDLIYDRLEMLEQLGLTEQASAGTQMRSDGDMPSAAPH